MNCETCKRPLDDYALNIWEEYCKQGEITLEDLELIQCTPCQVVYACKYIQRLKKEGHQ